VPGKTGTKAGGGQAANSAALKNGQVMAPDKQQNLQDAFLNHVRKNKTPLTIFLVNGVKLQGIVTWFDNFCVLLRRDGHSQLVYKHAISTIMPGGPISFLDGDQNGER
jgi:host factor-I protein